MPGILLNPRRTGLIDTLLEMGARIEITNLRKSGGEKIGDLTVRASALKGVEVPPGRAPSMIDEYPILAVASAFAEGTTVMRGLQELRVKESDRLAAIVAGLRVGGVAVKESEDGMSVEGRGADGVPGGGNVTTHMDHRIAMSFAVLGLRTRGVRIDDPGCVAKTCPRFFELWKQLEQGTR